MQIGLVGAILDQQTVELRRVLQILKSCYRSDCRRRAFTLVAIWDRVPPERTKLNYPADFWNWRLACCEISCIFTIWWVAPAFWLTNIYSFNYHYTIQSTLTNTTNSFPTTAILICHSHLQTRSSNQLPGIAGFYIFKENCGPCMSTINLK